MKGNKLLFYMSIFTVNAAMIIPVRSAVRAHGMVHPVFLTPTLPKYTVIV